MRFPESRFEKSDAGGLVLENWRPIFREMEAFLKSVFDYIVRLLAMPIVSNTTCREENL